MTRSSAGTVLSGGVVAFNERRRLAGAVQSLLSQRLPTGCEWGEILLVVSGSTDGTDAVARTLAAKDSRIRTVIEPGRNGKSAAISEVFRRARGDYLVLLNGDAEAAPGAVAALLEQVSVGEHPFAVMGRALPRPSDTDSFASAARLLWSIHNSFHASVLATREGNHLSDEMLLLPIRHLPPMTSGIVNDGSFVGGWLTQNEGTLHYAHRAVVRICCPRSVREHVRQRRRIRFGHRQVRDQLAVEPLTIGRYARRHPLATVLLLAQETRRPGGVRALATLLAAEALAFGLAAVDARSNGIDHVRWKTIAGSDPTAGPESGRSGLSAEGA
ncbi:MAG: glycosyltransferase [Thermoplasmata archaeon]|nr:glycosyltransferase [Thermoplasmata archaeon]